MAINKIILNTDSGDQVLVDLTGDTVVEDALVVGYTAHGADGEPVAGGNPYEKTATDTTVQAQGDLIGQLKSAIAENVSKTTAEVDAQAGLIEQIKTALEGKAGGGVQLPELTNPGTAGDLANGKQLIGADGSVVTGNVWNPGNLVFDEEPTTIEYRVADTGQKFFDTQSPEIGLKAILNANARVTGYIPAETFGNAKPENVSQGVTFTSENGLKIEGTAVMGGGGATVKTATARPTANSTSIQFTGLTGMPKMFSICPTGNVTFNTSNRFIVNVMYDGTTTRGIYAAGSGSWNATYTGTHSATYYTWTYNNGTLTITASSATNGGYFAANVTYQLTYAV